MSAKANSTESTNKKQIEQSLIVAALEATGGMIYLAAEKIGCHPATIYNRAKEEQEIADAILNARERFLDTAESALKKAVKAGEAWAVCFTLKTIGKKRGYVERTESYTYDLSHATDEQLDRIAAGEDPAHVLSDTSGRGEREAPPLASERVN